MPNGTNNSGLIVTFPGGIGNPMPGPQIPTSGGRRRKDRKSRRRSQTRKNRKNRRMCYTRRNRA
jgi:hypothetical protein